ncbi:MAG TPA: GAF domain-containing protein [Candidatus Acidoferrales bacterium]|nr:GAF domain-containing protein [Candidatus Acidoferrales bacterium]
MASPRGRLTDPGRAVAEFEFLQRLSQSAASTMDSGELVDLIIRETTSSTGTDVCSLYLVSTNPRKLTLSATNGLNERMVGRVSLTVGEGITGWVAETRTPKVVPEVSSEPHWKWVPGLDEDRFHSMLSVPIESGPRLVGVLNVQSVQARDFTQADIDFLRALAGQVAGILERSELQRRLEAQLQAIQLSHDIHERFTKLSLDGAGISSILEAVGALAEGAASLYSPAGFRVRGTGEGGGDLARLPLPPGMQAAGATEIRIHVGQPPRGLDLVPVRAGLDLLGILVVQVPDEAAATAADGRRRALQHGATVLALELAKERAAAEVERRLRGDLIEEVLAGGLDEEEAERLARQAERLGHRLPSRAWAIVLEPDDAVSESEMAVRGRQDRLDAALAEVVKRRIPGALMLVRSSSAVVLAPESALSDLAAVEKVAELIQKTAAPILLPATVSVGVGNLAAAVSELARSHVEARQSLRLSRRAGTRSGVVSYRSLGAFRLLLEVQSPEALRGFVREVLGPLFKYAESRETPLLQTLEVLASSRWVRRAASRSLGIHINSMTYRIERIESLTGLALDDPETRVAIAIALRARVMLGM